MIREIPLTGAVSIHNGDLVVTSSIAGERDSTTIRRPIGLIIKGNILGEPYLGLRHDTETCEFWFKSPIDPAPKREGGFRSGQGVCRWGWSSLPLRRPIEDERQHTWRVVPNLMIATLCSVHLYERL